MFIRYFCRIGNDGFFEDLSFIYFEALKGTAISIRVLPTNLADLSAPNSRWEPFNEELMRTVPVKYTNVICGDYGELARLYTLGTKNIAITAVVDDLLPSDEEITVLKEFDTVICSSNEDAQALRQLGVMALHAEPTALTLARLL